MLDRGGLLFCLSIALNIVLTVCLIFSLLNKPKIIKEELAVNTIKKIPLTTLDDLLKIRTLEEILNPNKALAENILQNEAVITDTDSSDTTVSASPKISYSTTYSSSSLNMAGIRGRVNTGEINPVNYENPDINILKQMGADLYLIHYFTGEQFFKAGNYDNAVAEYTTSINKNSGFADAFISRGNVWLRRKEYGRAIEDFSYAIRLDSNRAEIFNYRGFARAERGEYTQAIEDFSRAISINPNYVDALINRSHCYYHTGNYDKVIEDCTRIINLEPDNAVIWNRRGSAYYNKEDDDKAIIDFSEAIRLRRNYAVAYQNRGNAWQSKGDMEKANADYAVAGSLR